MVNNNSSKFVAISAAIIICGLLSTMTCTSGTYEILPVSDLQISQSDECIDLGDTRSYFPAQSKLNYAANSACTPGTLLCIRDRSNVRRWKPIDDMAPFAPADMGTEICNGIDDDCNGRIDDVPDLGASCSAGKGFCKSDGVWTCKPGNQFGCSAPMVSRVMTNYYACPHAPYEQKAYFDYDCDGSDGSGASPHLPIAGKLITGTFLGQAIQTASLPTIYDPNTSCVTQCSSVNTITYQYQTMQDKTIASSIKDNCGSVFKITKCEYKIAAASCQITDVETWAVYCK